MRQKENKEERDFVNWLRDAYPTPAIALKLVFFAGKGWPDRTILVQGGRIFFIEFKHPDKPPQLRPSQKKWKRVLEKLGFTYYVCTSCKQAQELTREFMERS